MIPQRRKQCSCSPFTHQLCCYKGRFQESLRHYRGTLPFYATLQGTLTLQSFRHSRGFLFWGCIASNVFRNPFATTVALFPFTLRYKGRFLRGPYYIRTNPLFSHFHLYRSFPPQAPSVIPASSEYPPYTPRQTLPRRRSSRF